MDRAFVRAQTQTNRRKSEDDDKRSKSAAACARPLNINPRVSHKRAIVYPIGIRVGFPITCPELRRRRFGGLFFTALLCRPLAGDGYRARRSNGIFRDVFFKRLPSLRGKRADY